jgi:SAM-dependent methyltransferase
MNEEKLHEFLGQLLQDLGGAFSIPLVRMGDSMGFYRALHEHGPMTSVELAYHTGLAERYLREWLAAQAASNYITYDPASRAFSLSPEQAAVLADEDSPVFMTAAFELAASSILNQPVIEGAFKTGEGVRWADQPGCFFCAVAKFFRPTYQHHLIQDWLPTLEGITEKLERGGTVADIGCGHGVSTVTMATAFPNSKFVGYDFHEASVVAAREHAAVHGKDNVQFEQALAKGFHGREFDLACFFDCLHDMGDPAGAMAHAKQALKPDGTCMIVEPIAGDKLEDNMNPVGRLYYSGSLMGCVPTSLAQEVGAALGAQAGEKRLREVAMDGGFREFRRVAETPFNMIFEARL